MSEASNTPIEPKPGDTVRVRCADESTRIKKVALKGVVLNSDFPVVWVRGLSEPDTDPGLPWPLEDVEVIA